jgi:integral membrane protein
VFSLKTFRVVALTEATSFLLLLVASVLRRTTDTDLVPILGPIHGVLFVAYVLIALNLRDEQGWSVKETAYILLGAVLPFGGYVVDRRLKASSRSPVAP